MGGSLFRISPGDTTGFICDGEPLVTARVVDDEIVVDAHIRDANGNYVVQIVDNRWKVQAGGYWNKIAEGGLYEFQDMQGNVAFQLVHFGDVVCVQSVFLTQRGTMFGFTNRISSYPETKAPYLAISEWTVDVAQKLVIPPLCDFSNLDAVACYDVEKLRRNILPLLNRGWVWELSTIDLSRSRWTTEGESTNDDRDSLATCNLTAEFCLDPPIGHPHLSVEFGSLADTTIVTLWMKLNSSGVLTPAIEDMGPSKADCKSVHCLIKISCEEGIFAKDVQCVVFEAKRNAFYGAMQVASQVQRGRPVVIPIQNTARTEMQLDKALDIIRPNLNSKILSIGDKERDGFILIIYSTPDGEGYAQKYDYRYKGKKVRFGVPILYSMSTVE